MAVVEGKLPVGISDKQLDTVVVEQADGEDAHREMVSVGDPETAEARAAVTAQALVDQYGLVVRDPRFDDLISIVSRQCSLLEDIKFQLNLITEFDA